MANSTLQQILALTAQLSPKELKELSLYVNQKWSLSASLNYADDIDTALFHTEIADAFLSRYHSSIPPLPILAKQQKDVYSKLADHTFSINQWARGGGTVLQRVEKSVFYSILINLVLDAMDTGDIPITFKYFVNRFSDFKLHFENAFPNYIDNKLLPILLSIFRSNHKTAV